MCSLRYIHDYQILDIAIILPFCKTINVDKFLLTYVHLCFEIYMKSNLFYYNTLYKNYIKYITHQQACGSQFQKPPRSRQVKSRNLGNETFSRSPESVLLKSPGTTRHWLRQTVQTTTDAAPKDRQQLVQNKVSDKFNDSFSKDRNRIEISVSSCFWQLDQEFSVWVYICAKDIARLGI